MTPGLIIAAPRSGAGKTTVALGLMRALTRRGLTVQPFKCGPDYIDPAFHAAATGRPSFNLDGWAMRHALLGEIVDRATADADIAIVEGVMGLFDGAPSAGQCGTGSTADLAALTGWPVVLVLDVAGQAETAAAVALGCKHYRDDIRSAGVILNRVASPRHLDLMAPAFARLGIPVLGALARNSRVALPERHLGLVQAGEHAGLEAHLDELGAMIGEVVRLDEVIAAAGVGWVRPEASAKGRAQGIPPPGQRIALAQDRAFSFMYPHLLAGWREAGAEIRPFSPMADEPPDASADAAWLPGGYPELYAGQLAACERFRAGVIAAAGRGAPIHGECGGYMVLGAGLVDAGGQRHRMIGLLGVETSFAVRRLHLGYRRARLLTASALGPAGTVVLGHEFHYATVLASADEPLVDLTDAKGAALIERGSRRGTVSGTFFHAIDRAG